MKWVTKKKKKVPRTKDGAVKLIIGKDGIKRYCCIECGEYKTYKEMTHSNSRMYGVASRCRECRNKLDRAKNKKKNHSDKDIPVGRIKRGILIGVVGEQSLKYPPRDAKIPHWIKSMGYAQVAGIFKKR